METPREHLCGRFKMICLPQMCSADKMIGLPQMCSAELEPIQLRPKQPETNLKNQEIMLEIEIKVFMGSWVAQKPEYWSYGLWVSCDATAIHGQWCKTSSNLHPSNIGSLICLGRDVNMQSSTLDPIKTVKCKLCLLYEGSLGSPLSGPVLDH